jgi:hypothetical protein
MLRQTADNKDRSNTIGNTMFSENLSYNDAGSTVETHAIRLPNPEQHITLGQMNKLCTNVLTTPQRNKHISDFDATMDRDEASGGAGANRLSMLRKSVVRVKQER